MRSRSSTQVGWMGMLVVPALVRALEAVRVVGVVVRRQKESRRRDSGHPQHSYD